MSVLLLPLPIFVIAKLEDPVIFDMLLIPIIISDDSYDAYVDNRVPPPDVAPELVVLREALLQVVMRDYLLKLSYAAVEFEV